MTPNTRPRPPLARAAIVLSTALAALALTLPLAASPAVADDGIEDPTAVEPAHPEDSYSPYSTGTTDVVGSGVSSPVTVDNTVVRDSDGELALEGNRVPDIVALDANNLVAGWRTGAADPIDPDPNDAGSIKYAYSSDGGATWTKGTLAAATSTYRWHYVIFLNDGGTLYALLGRITVADDRDANGLLNGQPAWMVAKKSVDKGHTWTDHAVTVNVAANSAGAVIAGKPLKYNGTWLIPYWQTSGVHRAGVLRSTDLKTFTPGGLTQQSTTFQVEEPQVVVSHDDPGKLLMITRVRDGRGGDTAAEINTYYRTHATYAGTATSTDGGLTWTGFTFDTTIPNYYVKPFLAKASNGSYLSLHNTFGGPLTGTQTARPDQYREVLYYQVKRPGAAWGPARLFADGKRETVARGRGWDTYPSASEYAPGKFFVIWEHQMTNIRVAKIDISAAFTGTNQNSWSTGTFDGVNWTKNAGGGTVEPNAAADLHLANAAGTTSGATQPYGPKGGFIATLTGQVTDYSTLDPATGVGASLALKVATGTRRLMLSVQADGVYSFVDGVAGWSRVYAIANDTASHQWRVTVDAAGNAALYRDAAETGATWKVAANAEAAKVSMWTSGTSANGADAVVNGLSVVDNVASSTWDGAGGWTLADGGGTAEATGGNLHLVNADATFTGATFTWAPSTGCDFSVDFRGQVDDDSALDPSTGVGASLATKVANGSRRLMLTIQSGGVWSMKKGSNTWVQVYSSGTARNLNSWRVDVSTAGVARLYRNGADTGATWVVQDSREDPKVTHWVSGTAGGNAAEATIQWTRTTCRLN